ncbi:hypothetical protein [uncultured Methanobrevibacter sp.]|uniref:hypothetical protein n=1 Tax=uncultured Methanobrevibacter sp. TaxID=253161 RepID=UPI0026337E58|nr:hypothetical protein [uncultured Methanobrevibacter sp.]
MAEFQEDMLFKNVADVDARILLDIMGIESQNVKVWTKELRQIDPTTYKPDLILDLDDENLIVEFQSTKVGDDFSRRAHSYVAITDQHKENDKEVNLVVLSTDEDSKIVEYKCNKLNSFKYTVIGLNNLSSSEIINNVETKLKNKEIPTSKDVILLSLVPLSKKGKNIVEYIYKVVKLIYKLKNLSISQLELALGILWLTTDKFVEDDLERNNICDRLGDRMSLIDEYGENKYRAGMEQIIVNFLKSGDEPEIIAEKSCIPLDKVLEIKERHNL